MRDWNIASISSFFQFHVAAANGWTNVIDFLLENEADFEVADNDGWQPIHAAAAWGHVSAI